MLVQVEGMWPYWLDGLSQGTVRNSFALTGMVLLTGPNMGGKSSVMRSTMAVALLGACGLFAPVSAARLPYIEAFMLRTFSADAPIQARSSFAVEMDDMRFAHLPPAHSALVCCIFLAGLSATPSFCSSAPAAVQGHIHRQPTQPSQALMHALLNYNIAPHERIVICLRCVLEDAGPGALVLVDELGKGTEARAGTALAAAFLERLSQDGCCGIFATCVPPQRAVPF